MKYCFGLTLILFFATEAFAQSSPSERAAASLEAGTEADTREAVRLYREAIALDAADASASPMRRPTSGWRKPTGRACGSTAGRRR